MYLLTYPSLSFHPSIPTAALHCTVSMHRHPPSLHALVALLLSYFHPSITPLPPTHHSSSPLRLLPTVLLNHTASASPQKNKGKRLPAPPPPQPPAQRNDSATCTEAELHYLANPARLRCDRQLDRSVTFFLHEWCKALVGSFHHVCAHPKHSCRPCCERRYFRCTAIRRWCMPTEPRVHTSTSDRGQFLATIPHAPLYTRTVPSVDQSIYTCVTCNIQGSTGAMLALPHKQASFTFYSQVLTW